MAKISRDDVLKLARLAKLSLDDAEADELANDLGEILHYVEQLQSVNVSGLNPTDQVTGLTNVMREDQIEDYGYKPEDLLKNVPRVEDNHIKVRRVL
jgi:aspartyl-tRNA(Asn)/glutamyl-tRNA(Gln) amidotransferase subunit C